MSQDGNRSGSSRARRQRNRAIAIIGVIGAAAFVGGFALAGVEDGGTTATSASPSRPRTRSPSPSVSDSPTASPSDVVADGRFFVQTSHVERTESGLALTYDLAYFYKGDRAVQVAAQRGDPPPESGYYIVNDNPRLRTVPIAAGAAVAYVPQTVCCQPEKGDLDAWTASVNGEVQTDYPDPQIAWWWITVSSGKITSIQQQYLP